ASRAAQAEALQQRVIGALAQHLDQATAADLAQRREDAAALVADLAERLEQASAADLVQRQEESAAQLAALRDQLAASTSAQARAVGEVLETQQASLAEQLEQVLASEAAARQSDAAAVRADLVGVVEATLRDANDDESTRRLTEVREMREALMGAQLALADAVRSALADAAAADAAVRTGDSERLRADGEALRSEITHLVEATRAEIDRRLTEITDHGTEQVRADLAAGVARMGDVQAAVMRTELDAVLSSLEPRFDQIAETARVESAVVAGLRSELKEVTERAAAGTVAALRDDVLELRMALNAIQSNGSAATDSLALLRTEGMMELRVRLAEDVEGNLERVAAATRDAIEAANSRTADALRAELAVFQRATEERRDNETSSLDQLVQSLRGEIEGLRATLHTVVAEANTGDAEAIAQLRSELRTVIERTTQETVAALRSDVAGLRTSLGAVELAGAAAADGVAALRAEGGEGLRGTLRSDLESLMTQLGLGLASSMERTSGRSAEAVQEELLAFRRSIGEALQQETRARETALQVVSDELQATVAGLDRKITATLDVGARTERERLDALREDVAAALDDLRTTLREGVADRGDDEALTALRDELRDSVRTLETTLGDALRGDTDAQRAQQRALRDELADALGSVAELVVDTARSEAQSRAAAFDAAGQRIDQLARATAAVVGAQAELRNMLMQLWGQ
ncbi:MAG: hypothetical protein M3Z03_00640, partial [Actinomycetota bacterium]|nr:hypothetical protein [Actinomycetota bacterium]